MTGYYIFQVKTWFTFNEPWLICNLGYGGKVLAPNIKSPGIGVYQTGQILLKAHAKTYHLYKESFKKEQKGNNNNKVSFLT